MARNHARIQASIWQDSDFLALSAAAQRGYMLALSQPGMTLCGVVDYTARRWAAMACDTKPADIDAAVDELQGARFVHLDADTEELWICSFVKHDGVLESPNLVKAMWKAVAGIFSTPIRDALLWTLPDEAWREDCADLHEPFTKPSANPLLNGTGKSCPTPEALSLHHEPARPNGAAAFAGDFDRAWELYPRKLARKDALKAFQARRREGIPADQLVGAVVNFAAAMAGRDTEHVMHGATFFGPNERWHDYREPVKVTRPADPADDAPGAHHCDACGELDFLPGTGRMACRCSR